MGLLAEAFAPRPRASSNPPGPLDDFWYVRDPSGYVVEAGSTGIALSAETILRCGTVLAAVRFRGDSWAMCPPSTFIKTARGRKEDPTHYSQIVLRNPNSWQTGNRWRHLNGVWMATWGNAYNEIRPGRKSFAEELWPMHPSRVVVKDQRSDGSLLYEYTRPGSYEPEIIGQERVLHFRDIGIDGFKGLEMYRLIRNVAGIALLAEKHAATFLRKGTRISGLLVPSAPLDDQKRQALRESVNQDLGGPGNTGTLGVLPHGIDLKQLSQSHRDSQYAELNDQLVGVILRFLGVPGVVVGWADKTATYASAEAFFEKGGIKHCVLPILINVEAEEEKALLNRGDNRQIKHNLDVLERANLKDRTEALVRSIGGPFRSVNEGRTIEDMDLLDDPRYDEVLTPSNMAGGNEPEPDLEPQPPPLPPPRPATPWKPSPEDDDEEGARVPPATPQASGEHERLLQYARDNALRLIKREKAAITAKAEKLDRDTPSWKAAVLEFYEKHAAHVAEVMRISEEAARSYCDRQAGALLAGGAAAMETWEDQRVPALVELALGEQLAQPERQAAAPAPTQVHFALHLNQEAPTTNITSNTPVTVDLPAQKAPIVNVQVPPQKVPIVHVEVPPAKAPVVNVDLPPQKAPVVNVNVERPLVKVTSPDVRVTVPKNAIKVENTTKVETTLIPQKAEDGIQKMEIVSMPPIKVAEVPTTRTRVEERDDKGRIAETCTEQEE